MATSYTVVLFSRQHIGNEAGVFNDVEPNVAFVGRAKDFPFDCPGINTAEAAVLMFQSRDVDHQRNVLRVNDVDVFGGLPASPARDAWNGNVLLVEPHHQLKAAGNVLSVEARRTDGSSTGDVDDFIIDNVVIMYKTVDVVPQFPTATGDLGAFLSSELIDSITNVLGSGSGANTENQKNEYVLPTPDQLASWRVVFQSLLAGDWGQAHVQARTISSTYNVVRFFDTPSGRTHFLLMEGVPGQIPAAVGHPTGRTITNPADQTRRGWGTYVFAAHPRRALSLSAPHLRDDAETEDQAIEAYLALGARTLLIAGTDRDQNKADNAPCEPSLRPYKESDVSHSAECVFQIAFEEIYTSDTTTWHIQFHGSGTCTEDVFLSNGVPNAPAPVHALAANIVAVSSTAAAAAGGGPVINARVFDSTGGCNARGTDNMQMRFASGRSHATICPKGNGPIGPSRFIHLEQLRTVRRAATDTEASAGVNRNIVRDGIAVTFP
jgi:hypothetical protein